MLMHQHTTLFGPDADLDSDRVGMIDPNCRMAGVIKNSYQQAAFLCEEYYQVSKASIRELLMHNFHSVNLTLWCPI